MDAHNFEHYKNKKKVLKSEINNGEPEVYVLPPDLLQKLGINLGSVNADLQLPLDAGAKRDFFDQVLVKNAHDMFSSNTDKTISETASLLKESMLITGSPSITPTVSRIGGEIEISNEAVVVNNVSKTAFNGTEKSDMNGKAHQNHIDALVDADLKEKHINVSDEKSTIITAENIFCVDSTGVKKQLTAKEHNLEEDKDENKNYYESTVGNKRLLKDKIRSMVIKKTAINKEIDAKDPEVPKSKNNYIDSNVEPLDCSDDLLSIPNRKSFKISCPSSTSKISIISEEIVDCSKLRELKKKNSRNVADLTPVTINTVITTKKTDDSKNTQQRDTLLKIKKYSDESHKLKRVMDSPSVTSLAINEINETKNSDKSNALENESYSFNNTGNNLPGVCMSNGAYINLLDNQLNTLEENKYKSIQSDGGCMVNKSLDEPDSIKHCNKNVLPPLNMNGISNEETNLNNVAYNECNDPIVADSKNILNVEQNVITAKSKLSVQGVEKPGGEQNGKQSENIPKIIKTYPKCKRVIHTLPTKSINNVVSPLHEICTKEINAIVCHEECKYEEFCICRDFGRLRFHDEIREYEHIHFSKRDIPGVDPELIFSIYDDEHCNRSPDIDLFCTNIDSEEDSNKNIHFCWNEYPCKENPLTKNEVSDYDSCSEQGKNSYDTNHTKETSKQKSAPTDNNSLESENNDLEKTNSKVYHKADKPIVLCNNREVQLTQPNAAIQKNVTEGRESSSGEILASSDKNRSLRQKGSDEPLDILESSNPNANTMNVNNKKELKIYSRKSLSISDDGSKQSENRKELSSVNINKESSNDLPPEQIIIDVEIPIPKRKRGRPRKVKPISDITLESTVDKTDQNNQTNDTTLADISKTSIENVSITSTDTPAKDQNKTVEETPPSGRRRTRRTIVPVEYSEDTNYESVRPSRSCARRLNRNQSSHSTSTCNEDNYITKDISENDDSDVQCGVCNAVVKSSVWIDHIGREHEYLAWKEGSKPLELNDELEVKNHLQDVLKEIPALVCYTCGIKRKYITAYLKHRKICDPNDTNMSLVSNGTIDHDDLSVSLETSKKNIRLKDSHGEVRCGVCNEVMKGTDWIRHIQTQHYYLAWADGETPLDLNDAEEVKIYLMALGKNLGGLTCHKCGLVRKYANIYLQHVKSCDVVGLPVFDDETCGDKVRCAVCSEEVIPKEWKHHAMSKHYNIAWVVGAPPIDVKNYYVVETYLKEYKNKYNKLICKVCRNSKVSCCGFYAHIIQCGKTEEEIDKYRELCNICNKQYLCMYKSQHMTMHREKEYAKERKLKLAEEQVEQAQETVSETPGRRRAAEKARNVIAKYKDECKANNQKDADVSTGYSSDSDVSVKLEQYTDDESDDTDDQYDISEEEGYTDRDKKRKRAVDSNAPIITRIPFPIKNVRSYIQDSFEDFCNNHLTKEKLFPEWSDCEYHKLSEEEIDKYMPPLKESCKVKVTHEAWSTYKCFEVENNNNCITLFVGASIQCMSWCPVHLDDINGCTGNFLAVACHSGKDSPRYNCDEAPVHSNLLQIWDFGDLQSSKPKLALGLAHDYGTIWAMDWCPSGARDLLKEEDDGHSKRRLGLLSIACSNGSAYILSVPYPSAITVNDEVFYKIKPVAELKLSSMVGDERKYQATTLRWSLQKEHNIIMVGYSNGTIAYFDLSNESPLLVAKENGVTIVHPYYDERSHTSCVTGVDLYAGDDAWWRGGAACSASPSGARVVSAGAGAGAAMLSALACAGAFFLPHWPSAVLTAVNSKVNQTVNELEWQSVWAARSGRRVGGVRAHAPCRHCAALAAADQPLLTVLHAHPAHPAHHMQHTHHTHHTHHNNREHDIRKYVAGILQMTSLAQKRKQTNDELAMKLEPLTYDDAVQKYGIEFQLVPRRNKACQQKALSIPMLHYPERFPLAEITSMSFCPAAMYHNRLAVGTHAGILFLINVS